MAKIFHIHPQNPQARLIQQAVQIIQNGGVVIYPTDSAYALGCHLGDKDAIERIRIIRELDKNHHFTLVCHNLSQLASYAKVDNPTFRLLKAHTPGAYTFILEATKEVPRRLMHPKRKTIGLRVPDNLITQALLAALNEPLMSVTLILPAQTQPLADIEEIMSLFQRQVDLIIDGGPCPFEATSVVDLTQIPPQIIRAGKGDIHDFLKL
jgi:tRNA threonylcarbamoyl adenosine modification protein (Sua5/YciO/YrdC/YwlC family)